jgi:hypothetical protein
LCPRAARTRRGYGGIRWDRLPRIRLLASRGRLEGNPRASRVLKWAEPSCGPVTGAGSFHLREAVEADKCGGGLAGSDVNDHRCAAVGVSLRQGSDELGTNGQAKREASPRIGADGAADAEDRVAAGCTLRDRETGVSEWAPGIAAGRSLAHRPWAAE